MPLEVIGAGLGRTGTRSLKDALEILGFSQCYHMEDLFADPSRVVHWEHAAAGEPTDWEALFAGYRSAVDYPAARHWRELAAVYPKAKVILTIREATKWYKSVSDTIYRSGPRISGEVPDGPPRIHRLISNAIWYGDFAGRFEEPEFAMNKFAEHNAAVIAGLPPERLLVYRSGEGWGPLCEFLGVGVPDVPYPHRNTTEEFRARQIPGRKT
jgi:hypothetical protein